MTWDQWLKSSFLDDFRESKKQQSRKKRISMKSKPFWSTPIPEHPEESLRSFLKVFLKIEKSENPSRVYKESLREHFLKCGNPGESPTNDEECLLILRSPSLDN